jgi:GMP synthase (glutamine-hydrolysing)
MKRLVDEGVPTFASCWGFQAMSLALGGDVHYLPNRGHVGTCEIESTLAGQRDDVFGALGATFTAQLGHEDVVTEHPPEAVVLAHSTHGDVQAWRIGNMPIWGTQFHPELRMEDLALRLQTYTKYIREHTGLTWETFEKRCLQPSPGTDALLASFAKFVHAA